MQKSRNINEKAYKTTTTGFGRLAKRVRAERRRKMPNQIRVGNIDSGIPPVMSKKESDFSRFVSPSKLPKASIERNPTNLAKDSYFEKS